MAAGMVLAVAQTLFSALQTKEVRELCSFFGHESRLAELESTVQTIKAVLEDAAEKEFNNEGKLWLGKLKDAVYDADDLFDEFNTVAQKHRSMPGSKISKKVRRFFSGDNQLLFAANTSRKIKKLRDNLDSIAKDRMQFGLGELDRKPLKSRQETFSYVYESAIIGREHDKKVVFDRLSQVSDAPDKHVSFVCIVGMGGLGKTALAQCVFNDDKFKTTFELSLWVCVSDAFGMKEIMCKMLGRSTDQRTAEELHKEVRQKIEGKRYFLVLDDVWEEDPNKWDELRLFLLSGAEGSSIIVTTRSKNVAAATGGFMHELKGLSDEDSLQLFKRVAFHQGSGQLDESLVDIGKDIVKKCANVPLSIRVMGSMLRGKNRSTWQSFQKNRLPMIGQEDDQTMSTLKYSYDYLESPLKTCFSYCALFPKDYEIHKEMLINLWLAEGCIEHQNNVHDIEIGENYFWSLLQRCFFQDIKKNQYGEIYSIKMHDLIHDLATNVAGNEMRLVMDNSSTKVHYDKIRHFSLASTIFECFPQSSSNPSNDLSELRKMRTFLRPCEFKAPKFEMDKVFINCKKLRVLDLHKFEVCEKPLDVAMKNLSLLRYLDLSYNRDLEMLPKTVSRLYNLQVLNLRYCFKLRELPADLKEMMNLKSLDIVGCEALTHMPEGMGNLTNLYKLSMFVVDGGSSNQVLKGQLRDLTPLYNLRGELKIELKNGYSCDETSIVESGYLENKVHLKALEIIGKGMDDCLIERLQPHQNLEWIEIGGYKSIRVPCWVATMATSLPHLVKITLNDFDELQQLPQFSQLRHLKILALWHMPHVEYMEDGVVANPFFPSLKRLILRDFPKLKRWWRSEVVGEVERGSAGFSCLVILNVRNCPNMTSFPGFPIVKNLHVSKSEEALTFCRERKEANESHTIVPAELCCSSSSVLPAGINKPTEIIREDKSGGDDVIYLDKVWINNMGVLNSVLRKSPALSVADRCVFIQTLYITECHELKSLRDVGIQHLTNLHTLKLWNCNNLEMEEGEEEMMPWKALHKLVCLTLWGLHKVVNLPKGIQCLFTLQQLKIKYCKKLEGLPEWLHQLTSLEKLEIDDCTNIKSLPEAIGHMPSLTFLGMWGCNNRLRERCKEPDGVDCPKISHIPKVIIR